MLIFSSSAKAEDMDVNINVSDTTTIYSSVTTPVDNSVVSSVPFFSGTAGATSTTVAKVDLSLRDNQTGWFWDPSTNSWNISEVWFVAEGTNSWNFSGNMPTWTEGRNYSVRSRATGANSIVETPGAGNDFTYRTTNALRISPEYVQLQKGTQFTFSAYNGVGNYVWTTNSNFGRIVPVGTGSEAVFVADEVTTNSYTTVTVQSGTESATAIVVITENLGRLLDLIPDFSTIEKNSSVELLALGGLNSMSYNWEVKDENGQNVSGFLPSLTTEENTNVFTGLSTGVYSVKVVNNGVSDTSYILVIEQGSNLLEVDPPHTNLDENETSNISVLGSVGDVNWRILDTEIADINGSSTGTTIEVEGDEYGYTQAVVSDSLGNYGVGHISVNNSGSSTLFYIDPSTAVIPVGSAVNLSVYGGDGSVSWRMSNQTVGTTNIIGDRRAIFTGVSEGAVDVTVQDSSGNEVVSKILVVKIPPITCEAGSTEVECQFSDTELYLLPNFSVLPIGGTQNFTAYNVQGSATWELSSTEFGSINQTTGDQVTFSATQIGELDLSVRDTGGRASTARIMIFDPLDPPPSNREFSVIPGFSVLYPGQVVIMGIAGSQEIINEGVTWSSLNESVAIIDPTTGVLTAGVIPGTTTIIARTPSGEEAYATVIVSNPNDSLDVNPKFLELDIEETAQLFVSGGSGPIQYTSTNSSIASVDSNGVVRGVSVGNATIIVTRSGKVGFSNITVVDPNSQSFYLTPSFSEVPVGYSQIIVPKNFSGSADNIVWTSSDPANFEIIKLTPEDPNYQVGAVKVNVRSATYATIKAQDESGKEATATVSGIEENLADLVNNPSSVSFSKVGECITIQVLNKSANATGYTFESSNPTYVQVDENGRICAVNLPISGTAQVIITTTEEGTGRTAETVVTLIGTSTNDTDGDGMPDWWEDQYPCMDKNTSDWDRDYDNDGWNNMEEYLAGTNPCDAGSIPTDTDGDGMPDWWEIENGLDPNDPSDRDEDPDNDGLTNFEEYHDVIKKYGGTADPFDPDTDNDGFSDGDEMKKFGTNPLVPNGKKTNPNTGTSSIIILLSTLIAIKFSKSLKFKKQ